MVYFDNAATTFPKPESVYAIMDDFNRNYAVNAGRGSYKLAQRASNLIGETKNLIRQLVNADITSAVVLTPSITIAMNQIVQGYQWRENSTVYLSPYEHNAVARTVASAAKKFNIRVKLLPLDEQTLEINLEQMKYEFSKDRPDAVFCTHISNVTGYILPVYEIFSESKKYNALTVLDTAQSLGLINVDSRQLQADIIAFAGHKTLYGPLGVGGFVNISNITLNEFIVGGTGSDSLNLNMPEGSESRYEAASKNIVAIAGLCEALKVVNIEKHYAIEKELTKYLVDKLTLVNGIKLLIPANEDKHIGIVSFVYDGYTSEDVGMILDEDYDVAVRTGYHCAPYIHKFLNDETVLGTVRIGLSIFNTKDEIDYVVEKLIELGD